MFKFKKATHNFILLIKILKEEKRTPEIEYYAKIVQKFFDSFGN